MVFWKRAVTAVHHAVSQPEITTRAAEDPNAWLPEDAHASDEATKHLLVGPWRMDEESTLMDAFTVHANDVLRSHGIHASQVDGGLDFSRVPLAERTTQNQYNVVLEQVIDGLGIRYTTDVYPQLGFTHNLAGDIVPHFGQLRPAHDNYWYYWSYRYKVFSITQMNNITSGVKDFIISMTERLAKERIKPTPNALMGRLVLDTFQSTYLAPEVRTGILLPQQTSVGHDKTETHTSYIPQIYYEYLRSNLPISYLLAAFLPVYNSPQDSRWHPSATKTEPTPRFNIVDVYAMRDAPVGLGLEMVGASKNMLIAEVK